MPAVSWNLRSWLKSTPSTKITPPARLGCERLEDRLTPSAAPLPYVPPSYFFLDQTQTPAPSNGAPLANALAYLNAHSADFGLSPTDLAQSRLTDLYTDSHTGVTHIYLRQTVNGLEVENANLNISVGADGRVLTAAGGYVAGLSGLIGPGVPTPGITAAQAVQFAADELGIASAGSIQVTTQPVGIERSSVISAPGVSLDPITARLHYVPTANGSAELSWQLIIRTTDFDHWYDLSIDASSGGLATLVDWTEDAIYNVIAAPNEDPQDGGFAVLIDPHNPLASPHGWHDDDGDPTFPEYTDTRGNNVHTQLDHDNNNVADGTEGGQVRPDGGLFLDFSGFLFNPALNAESIQNANIAQINLFTGINFAHDVMYMYGFDEVAGNFQTNNYGNGGLGGDAVQGDAQDGFDDGDRNNANFSTPPDGMVPRMQQYIFDLSNPTRDSDLDIGVIFHEYGHGVSNRLAGGPANSGALASLQGRGMGEGWSDFYAMLMMMRPTDVPTLGYGFGQYVLGEPLNGPGLRRFKYSFNMTVDPLTFEAFGSTGVTSYGVTKSTQVHNTGEIWASALWDMNWLLIDKFGFDSDLYTGWSEEPGPANAGNKLALELVNLGLKLQPTTPTFIQSRDAILAADVVLTGGANQLEIWTAFARRGLGATASTPGTNADFVITDFRIPPSVSISPTATSVFEGTTGVTTVTFTVSLSEPTAYGVSIDFATLDGTATTADSDYIAANGTLTFAIGEVSKTISFDIVGDTTFEANETFKIVLSGPFRTFAAFGQGEAVVTILNEDTIPPIPPPPPGPPLPPRHILAVATDGDVVAEVRALEIGSTAVRWAANPFDGFAGTVSIAVGDIDGDTVDDVIVGAGPTAGPRIVVLSGIDGREIRSFFAFAPSYSGGVTVASGDLNGDGFADIFVAADVGGRSHVKVFDGRNLLELRSFHAFGTGFDFRIRIAAGDVNGDGFADVLVGSGQGSNSSYRAFDGKSGALFQENAAFGPEFTGGITIAAGDIDGDGFADIVIGAGTGSIPHVKAFSGLSGGLLASFFVNEDFSPDAITSVAFESGLSVGAADINGDGIDEILTTKGRGSRSILRAFRIAQRDSAGNTFSTGLQQVQAVNVFPGYFGGVTISG